MLSVYFRRKNPSDRRMDGPLRNNGWVGPYHYEQAALEELFPRWLENSPDVDWKVTDHNGNIVREHHC